MKLRQKITALLRRIGPVASLYINFKYLRRKNQRRLLRQMAANLKQKQNKSLLSVYMDIFIKCLFSYILYSEYADYTLYKKSLREARQFFTYGRWLKISPALKTQEHTLLFCNKPSFHQIFKDYIKRDFFVITSQTSLEDLNSFIERHPVFIAKPPTSCGGQGIWLVDSEKYANREAVYEILKEKGTTLLEERVRNHPALARFSKTSLNTLRLITLRLPEGVILLSAFLKFNFYGDITDNLTRGGFVCPLDLQTGLILKGMTNMQQEMTYIEHHPNGFYLPGIQIPYWEEAVALAKEATLFLDEVYYVPWDIAITENGPLIIEGNNDHDFSYQIVMDRPCNRDMQRAYRYALTNKKRKASEG